MLSEVLTSIGNTLKNIGYAACSFSGTKEIHRPRLGITPNREMNVRQLNASISELTGILVEKFDRTYVLIYQRDGVITRSKFTSRKKAHSFARREKIKITCNYMVG